MDASIMAAQAAVYKDMQTQQLLADMDVKISRILALLEKPVVEIEGELSGEGMEAPRKKVK